MIPEAQRIYDLARKDIIDSLIDATGVVRRRRHATEEDLMMFCIYGLASFVKNSAEPEAMMIVIIDLFAHTVGATMESATVEREGEH